MKQGQEFVNQKLEFVEELVLHTDAHIFLTGKAGTGKTTFLKSLPSKTFKRMVVVAPTGVAAINAGGQTIHSFFQLPFGPQLPETARQNGLPPSFQFHKLRRAKLNILRTLDLLVIDEVSMVRADVLDAVDAVLRRARRSQKPFGGVQLLMIGDVHQLAPVAKPEEWETLAPYYKTVYFFGSHVLQKIDYLCVELDHIYRQHDQDFISLLNKVRDNRIDAECLRLLNERYLPAFKPTDGYITLTTHNYQADDINESRLNALAGDRLRFEAEVSGIFPQNTYPTKELLELKLGAQVMFVKNDPNPGKAFYNGKIGMLTGYDEKEETVEVTCGEDRINVGRMTWTNTEYTLNEKTQSIEEQVIGTFSQIPLRLAWAVTIHKSQGLTFDKLVVDAQQAFAHGQVYVALSRCTSLQGLVLKTRLLPENIVSDGMVDYFVGQMPEREPSKEKVEDLRQSYELETILELFDFQDIYGIVGKVAKGVTDNLSLFESPMVQELIFLRDEIQKALCLVSKKFGNQVCQLHQNAIYEDNPLLQERLRKGAEYFLDQLTNLSDRLFKLPFKTDNKTLNEQLTENLNLLRELAEVKKACLLACGKAFSVDLYYKTKAVRMLEAEKSSKPAFAIKDGTMGKNSLYEVLNAWRADKAEDEGVEELYSIIPAKTLKAIAKEKPISIQQLKEIEGIGPKRVKAFGMEIVNIVRLFTGMEPLAGTLEIELTPKTVKRPKGETFLITKEMIDKGMSVSEIAEKRKLAESTIYGHLSRFVENGDYEPSRFVGKEKCDTIEEYFRDTRDPALGAAREVLGDDFEFWEIRMVQSALKRDGLFLMPSDTE